MSTISPQTQLQPACRIVHFQQFVFNKGSSYTQLVAYKPEPFCGLQAKISSANAFDHLLGENSGSFLCLLVCLLAMLSLQWYVLGKCVCVGVHVPVCPRKTALPRSGHVSVPVSYCPLSQCVSITVTHTHHPSSLAQHPSLRMTS